jgi:hypothetical protein
VIGWGDASMGAVDRFLAMLEATLDRWDEAVARYQQAVEVETRVGARASLVRTRACYSEVLRRRGRPGDEALADDLAAAARADAEALGMLATVTVPQ